jgi:hypothetical protein
MESRTGGKKESREQGETAKQTRDKTEEDRTNSCLDAEEHEP